MTLTAGTKLGPYEIVAPLGAGGMGEVYRARDARLGRDVAIKVLPTGLASTPEARARFEREAKTISQLNHPHICTLHDVGSQDGVDYLVLELVDGETLGERLKRGPLATPELLRIGAQVADALARAHHSGVVHRDLKPGNIMLTKGGAKLLDFGLARPQTSLGQAEGSGITVATLTQSPTASEPLTAEGAIVGTFQYMAPEQLEGKEADARADLWALGCVLYEMASGKRAFEGSNPASLISAIMAKEPAPLAQLAPMSPPGLERVVQQCLAKDPDERWQSAGDLKREQGPVPACHGPPGSTDNARGAACCSCGRSWRAPHSSRCLLLRAFAAQRPCVRPTSRFPRSPQAT
jgi:serine/threonine protein kinase